MKSTCCSHRLPLSVSQAGSNEEAGGLAVGPPSWRACTCVARRPRRGVARAPRGARLPARGAGGAADRPSGRCTVLRRARVAWVVRGRRGQVVGLRAALAQSGVENWPGGQFVRSPLGRGAPAVLELAGVDVGATCAHADGAGSALRTLSQIRERREPLVGNLRRLRGRPHPRRTSSPGGSAVSLPVSVGVEARRARCPCASHGPCAMRADWRRPRPPAWRGACWGPASTASMKVRRSVGERERRWNRGRRASGDGAAAATPASEILARSTRSLTRPRATTQNGPAGRHGETRGRRRRQSAGNARMAASPSTLASRPAGDRWRSPAGSGRARVERSVVGLRRSLLVRDARGRACAARCDARRDRLRPCGHPCSRSARRAPPSAPSARCARRTPVDCRGGQPSRRSQAKATAGKGVGSNTCSRQAGRIQQATKSSSPRPARGGRVDRYRARRRLGRAGRGRDVNRRRPEQGHRRLRPRRRATRAAEHGCSRAPAPWRGTARPAAAWAKRPVPIWV